ncbi:hypothetical protein QJS10_CPB15g01499 [Acorus calamus]|uniref:Calcineurin-like phosphoesterase domain-containing protein n=1 Tax=Acorus calamus TaxID=4465 RepID=A0AAV9D733_ACOCL|nr:hypothetical protein QJS10_CPB15g01499 [Acorus calamus]
MGQNQLWRLTLVLCVVWALSLLYGEMVSYWVPLWSCSWPSLTSSSSSNGGDQVNVAVIADPQLMDKTSLSLPPKSLALEAAQFYTDLYMRRSFRSSILPFKPHVVIFLGDQFDGGPLLSDEEWKESLWRFKNTFYLLRKEETNIYYLSGNHDIGYSGVNSRSPKVVSLFEKDFGKRNHRFIAGEVEYIAVDAQTLDGPLQGKLSSSSWEFVQNISKEVMSRPRILLTHIPLYRADETPCGSYRSSPIINQRIRRSDPDQGITYQNYLSEETSARLLELIKPILVLSGHDHDQCTVTHSTPTGAVTEHTLGTVSWQQGNLYPSFMLLSATSIPSWNTTIPPEQAVSTHLCFLPMQTHIYIWYLFLFVVTLLLLLFWPVNGLSCPEPCNRLMSSIGETLRSIMVSHKEKDEDEDCEYEMMWDAEGSMHLVKKASAAPRMMNSSDNAFIGRGNVVARPTARKTATQEGEVSVTVDMTADVKVDDIGKSSMFYRSKAGKVIRRFVRVFRLLAFIAAINLPLYMMLLFKDWNDH